MSGTPAAPPGGNQQVLVQVLGKRLKYLVWPALSIARHGQARVKSA